ncbi:uncharacterized protein LOC141643363 isoform X2 [Silene latifolia]|uniref:uncharacterized protein LOC141643363 isoform X2 n=1 Tax=Silene latifolia TaxID=37657 RepID=UPI003D77E0E0
MNHITTSIVSSSSGSPSLLLRNRHSPLRQSASPPPAAGRRYFLVAVSLSCRRLLQFCSLNREVPDLIKVLKEMKVGLDTVTSKVQALTSKVKEKQYPTAEGISYLEAKHLLLISYCQSLVYYLLRKAEGLSIEGHPVVRSLVEIRLFLEKIRPIDKKCGYLIERLLRTSATDAIKVDEAMKGAEENKKAEDLLKYRPNADNLVSKMPESRVDIEVNGDGRGRGGVGVYRPVKMVPTTMEGDAKKGKDKKNLNRKEEHDARGAKRSDYVRSLMDDLEGRPEEVRERVGAESKDYAKYVEQWEKREQLEEEQFNRAPITKREKARMKQIQRYNGLLGLADFRDEIRALPLGDDDADGSKKRFGGSNSMERKHNKRKRKH